jgi:hypothetical protein
MKPEVGSVLKIRKTMIHLSSVLQAIFADQSLLHSFFNETTGPIGEWRRDMRIQRQMSSNGRSTLELQQALSNNSAQSQFYFDEHQDAMDSRFGILAVLSVESPAVESF